MKMLNKTNVNMNFNMNQKPDAIVTNLLDDIADKIRNAGEGNIVDAPTPQNFYRKKSETPQKNEPENER